MKLSEVPLMNAVLCKNAQATWSEVFEIMKLGYSANGKAVYVRITFGMPGQNTNSQHYWRDVSDMDAKWEVFDTLTHNVKVSHHEDGMKKFRYPAGHTAGQTMTVKRLREMLAEYPEDMPVMAEWEGCQAYIDPERFEVVQVGKGYKEDQCDGLVIDVNLY